MSASLGRTLKFLEDRIILRILPSLSDDNQQKSPKRKKNYKIILGKLKHNSHNIRANIFMHIKSITYYKLFNTNKLLRINATYTLIKQSHIANSSKQVN
jgi:hypothetical protein